MSDKLHAIQRVKAILESGNYGRICDRCAKISGGVPPTDDVYISTYNFLVCDVCEQIKAVTSTRDWLWPWWGKKRKVSRET